MCFFSTLSDVPVPHALQPSSAVQIPLLGPPAAQDPSQPPGTRPVLPARGQGVEPGFVRGRDALPLAEGRGDSGGG